MSDKPMILTDQNSGESVELPIIRGTEGEPTFEIKAVPASLGYFTYDPGYAATASCTSKITFIDGEKGITPSSNWPNRATSSKSHTCS